jgi:peptidoglycan-N-acetylglucosamine deacetylase
MNWPISLGIWRPLMRRLEGRGIIGLTYDDGPTPETTPVLLDLLAKAGATATFFVSGVRARAHRELVQAIIRAGHAVYGHGWEHVNLEADPQRALADMCRVEDELARFRPTPGTYLVRLPYNAGWARPSMHRAMADFHPNVQFACWSHSTHDYLIAERCQTREDLTRLCRATAEKLRKARNLDGAIVLMHERPFDGPEPFTTQMTGVLAPFVLGVVAERRLTGVALRPLAPTPMQRWLLPPLWSPS